MKIEQSSFFDKFVRNIKKGKSFTLTGLTIFSRLLLLKYIFKLSGKKVLFITSTEQSALKYSSDLERLFELNSETLPYQNTSPYEVVTGNLYDYARQVNTLLNLPDIVIAPAKVLLEKFPSNIFFENNSFKLKVGESIDQKNLLSRLIKLGYKRSTMVSDIGEFSIRGDIADIYSLEENPVRVEFWGDEIIDIRFFNNETQKSIEKIKEITIEPLYKFILPDSTPEDFPKELQEQLDNEGYFEGVNVYQSYFNNDLVSVLDYFKDYIIVFDEYAEVSAKYQQIDDNFVNNYNEGLKTQNIHPLKEINHFTLAETLNRTAGMQKIYFNNFLSDENNEVIDIDARNVQVFDADMDEAAKFLKEHKGYQITIATDYQERVKEVLSDYDIFDINFIKNITSQGTEIQDGKILLLTDRELFNKRQKEVPSNRKRHYKEKAEYIESINDIKEGEYVVHSIHGVGVYKGLTKQEFDGQLKDYLTIEYANKDKLHIPAEQINMLCRYRGSGQVKPKLSRMGGSDWENTKTRVKKEVETIAYDLLRLYARRKMKTGIEFAPDSPLQLEMEDTFEYIETPDQLKSINQIKADMESPNPMDRLVCGDVGFGKTEVAMRAMFKAVTSLKQVAVIVPTTVLALQHYQTVSERFKPFGIDVELLCRFRSAKEKKETLKNLATGKCDVVIATHSLLQDNVIFKDLGLLVIDEEHRFGVRHKEKLKEFRENIDIISMSATPIPRTLALILYGDLDISIIDELPPNRKKIETFAVTKRMQERVDNFIEKQIKEGRQAYIVCPLVEESEESDLKSVTELAKKYQTEIFPQYRVAYLHGKMKAKEKDEIMLQFKNHEIDILISTTVIEVGVDVPNSNIMVIEDAQRFGLAQLHQLRGRVGRGEYQSYCILKYEGNGENIRKRMKVMCDTNDGFKISEKDLELRGSGDFFGTMQHGLPEFKIANLFEDMPILQQVQQVAQNILSKDAKLENEENKELAYIVNKKLAGLGNGTL